MRFVASYYLSIGSEHQKLVVSCKQFSVWNFFIKELRDLGFIRIIYPKDIVPEPWIIGVDVFLYDIFDSLGEIIGVSDSARFDDDVLRHSFSNQTLLHTIFPNTI